MLSFGYNAGLPADVEAAWGCRAIVEQQGYVDVPPDRQSTYGEGRPLDDLISALNEIGFATWRERAAEMLIGGDLDTRKSAEVELVNNGRVVIKGNTNASGGYLYVCAYRINPFTRGDTPE